MRDVIQAFLVSPSESTRSLKILPSYPEDYISQKNYKINEDEVPGIVSIA